MSRTPIAPPRVTAWLMRRLLPRPLRDEILAQIDESFACDIATVGRWQARWRWRTELFSILFMRLRGRFPTDVSNPGSPARKSSMDSLVQDLRFAFRRLLTRQGATVLIVALLTLGIGSTATLYTVLDAIFLRLVPYAEARRLVAIGTTFGPEHARLASISWPNYVDVKAASRSFEAIGAAWPASVVTLGPDRASNMPAAIFTEGFFDLLGVSPELGRVPTAAEHRGDDPTVALISFGAWQRLFAGATDLSAVEMRTLGAVYPVVGVLPRDFVAPEAAGVGGADLWIPDGNLVDQVDDRGTRVLGVIARLAEGVALGQAQAELDGLALELARSHPAENAPGNDPFGIGVRDLTEETAGDFGASYGILAGAVGALLLIAVVNVASILLAQAFQRAPEIALRSALGARRGRIARQLLMESIVLAVVGGICGVAAAYAGVRAFVSVYPGALPRAAEIGVDGRTIAFALLLSSATGVLCGFVPALRFAARKSAAGGRGGRTSGPKSRRFLTSLVVAEIALALVLFTSAALLVTSFARLRGVDPGFDARGLMVLRVDPGAAGADIDRARAYVTEVLREVRSMPAVASAAAVVNLPLQPVNWRPGVTFEDGSTSGTGVNARVASDGYFAALGVNVVKGRDFGARDGLEAPLVVLVNEAFVRGFLPSGDPLGRRLAFNQPFIGEQLTRTVVGVVADMKEHVDAEPAPELYVPFSQGGWPNARIVYRPRDATSTGLVLERVERVDSTVPIDGQRPVTEVIEAGIGQQRFLAQLVSIFAAIAVLLASAGIYALVAHGVQGRRREIGLRMAVGADARDVVGMVLRQTMRWALIGVVLGLAGAGLASRLLASQLYEVGGVDPFTYVAVAAGFTVISVLAALVPARRAARVDPVQALRAD